ncbi:MAG: NAD(P)H-binding protein [Microbacterium sp.]|uniref:NAD(P)-dependent oxidoreductase n=1 Tax=Microbacterium sp. TaxID=51671 RepID=UPI0039E418DA
MAERDAAAPRRIVVVGATGRIGKRVVARLVAHGHAVTGVNRRASRQRDVLGGLPLRTVVADASDAEAMADTVAGANVVVLATAPTREDPQAYLGQSRAVIAACRTGGVGRLVAVGNYKALDAPDGRPMLQADPPNPYFRELEEVFVAQRDLFSAVVDLDWLVVAPPADLFPYGEDTGAWRVAVGTLVTSAGASGAFAETSRMSMEDFTVLLVDEIEHPAHSRVLLTAAYA